MSQKGAIAAGWEAYRRMVVPADASATQVNETRQAFFAGAATLFEGLMRGFDPGEEPTAADLQRMSDIQEEVNAFGKELDERYLGKHAS